MFLGLKFHVFAKSSNEALKYCPSANIDDNEIIEFCFKINTNQMHFQLLIISILNLNGELECALLFITYIFRLVQYFSLYIDLKDKLTNKVQLN